jgi:shikimate kinase / 3-dehydroquinate synthase
MTQQPSIFAHLTVALGERSYPIVIGHGVLDAAILNTHITGKKIAIVTNEVVAPLYLDKVIAILRDLGKTCFPVILPDGEEEKNVDNLMHIFDVLLKNKCDRKTTLIALGWWCDW